MRFVLLAALLAARPLCAQDTPAIDPSIAWVASGGTWQTAHAHGHYRLVILSPGSRATSRLLIEWIDETGHRNTVLQSRPVTVIADTWSLSQPQFLAGPRVRATVAGKDLHTAHTATWILSLGPPGQFSISPVR